MSWTDRLVAAQYRGIEFFVDSVDLETGRDHVVHSFPYSDKHFVEDLGAVARRFRVVGYLIGPDFLYYRDKLVQAAERRPLHWPYSAAEDMRLPSYGIVSVHLSKIRIRETRAEGRIVTFDAEFVEAGELDEPSKAANAAALADANAEELEVASGEALTEELVTEGPGVLESARAATSAAIESVGDAMDSASAAINGPLKAVEAFQSDVVGFVNSAAALATAPLDLYNGARAAINGILNAAANFKSSLFAYEELLGLDLGNLAGGSASASGVAANRNVELVSQMTKELAAAGAIRSIARIEFESLDEAETRRNILKGSLDSLLSSASYQTYSILLDSCQLLVEVVPGENKTLPRLQTLTLKTTEPTLVVAHRLYADAARATEIALRNRVRRPGFVPAAEPLEVLGV
jgi:prophage DNA circulation protein